MITNVAIVSVFVKDIDESLKFYTEVLGFEAGADVTLGDGYRWCTVTHPNQPELSLHLTTPGPPMADHLVASVTRALDEGGMAGVGVNVDDCRATYEDLRAKGVEFVQEPSERPYGVEAVCRDNSGNWMVLVEQKAWRPEDFVEAP